MALELHVTYPSAATLYAIVRKVADATVWNGTTFGAWVDGSIATYDIPLTSHGGDLYASDFPAGITTAGSYFIDYYLQAGGTPAITDTRQSGETIYWDGTVVGVAPSGSNLVSLSDFKTAYNITGSTYDAQLSALIGPISRAVEFWLDREILATTQVEYYDGVDAWRKGYLALRKMPVSAISRVAVGIARPILIKNTDDTTNQMATVSVTATGLVLTRIASGVTTTNTLAFATYATFTDLAAAIVALSAGGWTATVQGDADDYGKWPTSYLTPTQGAFNARDGAYLFMYAHEIHAYRLETSDTTATLYGAFPKGFQAVEVRYTSGYSTVPEAIKQGVLSAMNSAWNYVKVGGNIQSEKIGDYSYTLATGSTNLNDSMFADARFFLSHYRRVGAL